MCQFPSGDGEGIQPSPRPQSLPHQRADPNPAVPNFCAEQVLPLPVRLGEGASVLGLSSDHVPIPTRAVTPDNPVPKPAHGEGTGLVPVPGSPRCVPRCRRGAVPHAVPPRLPGDAPRQLQHRPADALAVPGKAIAGSPRPHLAPCPSVLAPRCPPSPPGHPAPPYWGWCPNLCPCQGICSTRSFPGPWVA